ncbi:MAG TPA: hypothetical protein PKZ00_11805 [Elusimicrobiota bacterium]|nr:hypothetical protein [Elusimicrobiota bacterium]
MNIDEKFPRFMKAEDVSGSGESFTIESVSVKEFDGDDGPETKLIVKFVEEKSPLACNATNRKKLVKLFGPETDSWVGKKVNLHLESVSYKGESFDAIRVMA